MSEQKFEPGTLLVAHPDFNDPYFGKSVILVTVRGDDGGAVGVNVAEPPIKGRLYGGGPMVAPLPVMIHEAKDGVKESLPLGETGYAVTALVPAGDRLEPADLIAKKLDKSMVFLGYAGWGEGQLEGEADMGVWTRTKLPLDQLLQAAPADRWALAAAEAGLIAPAAPQAAAPAPNKPPQP